MASDHSNPLLRYIRRLAGRPSDGGASDGQLLDCFLSQRDEVAFETLLRRHGPMVLATCRRILRDDHEAEDAFQATFLVLCRKAGSIGHGEFLGSWLYQVACRIALKVRADAARRPVLVTSLLELPAPAVPAELDWRDLRPVLDEELSRLPEKYRAPLVLHYLEGKTVTQVAQGLGWPQGTALCRLARARERLRVRLTRRGVTLTAGAIAAALTQQATAGPLPAALAKSTLKVITIFVLGQAALPGAMATRVAVLAQGVLKAMLWTKLKVAAGILLVSGILVAGAGVITHHVFVEQSAAAKPVADEQQPAQEKPANLSPAAPTWPEGATVKGRVVNHRGAAVANAAVLLLGEEHIMVDAERRIWFVFPLAKDGLKPPSTRTDKDGGFSIERKKGAADRLAVIADDPLFWVMARKSLTRDGPVEIKLPPAGSIAIHCDLPGKPAKQPVMIQLRTWDGVDWDTDVLRFHMSSYSVTNPGETVFEHLPPGKYAVEREQETPSGNRSVLLTAADRQLVKVEPEQRATVRFERKRGRPLTGQVRGLENVELRYAHVMIQYPGPEEQFGHDRRRVRQYTAFDVIPITSAGRFTTDRIPPGKYMLDLFAVRSSTPELSNQSSDFQGQLQFTVPEKGDLPMVEVIAKPSTNTNRPPIRDARARVVDEKGKPLPKLQAMIHTADAGHSPWKDGRDGIVYLGGPTEFQDVDAVDVLVRADGYAPSIARFTGEHRNDLRDGKATITMRQGQWVELRFRLPDGMAWPKDLLPEAYFDDLEDRVRMMRQPENRKRVPASDFNMLNLRAVGEGRFELRVAPETPRFHVAVHAPGFLQNFETGPFLLSDFKQGLLEIDVPRPASLEVRFDPALDSSGDVPFKEVSLQVLKQLQGNSYLMVATEVAALSPHQLKLTDLASGNYLVNVRTQPKPETKPLPGTQINLGSYFDARQLALQAGQSERVSFRRTPFNPDAFRGKRTAVLRIRTPDGTPAEDRKLTVEYFDGHYGALTVFSDVVPASGVITLDGLTESGPSTWPQERAYVVKMAGKQLGYFGFTDDKSAPEFEFQLAPVAGDLAPDVELLRLAVEKPVRLSSLRGKVVCLEFWATWCGPCQPAMAKLNELNNEQAAAWKDRVALIPVSIDASLDLVQPHALRRGWNRLDHYWTGRGKEVDFDAPAARAFGVWGVPQTILIGPDGRILWRGHPLNKSEGQDLKSRIEDALKK
jgi:RNA polymerase sigma factor (sigma-70 family)